MKQVVFATISLHQMAGGLERNIIRISNYLASRGHQVSILSFDLADAVSFYPIDPKVTWHKLGRTAPHQKIGFIDRLSLLSRIRSSLSKNSTVIVFHHGLLARLMLAGLGLNLKMICSERSALSIYDHILASKWNLNFLLMSFVSKIIVQFETYKTAYPSFMQDKIESIPNIVEKAVRFARPAIPNAEGRYTLLAVGRLCDQKNYGPLIKAFANLAEKFPLWDLVIVGDGGLKEKLMAEMDRLNILKRVFWVGASQDVEEWYIKSHIYVMPSKWEGFPNALAEALAHGLPSIGFAGCDGVADLILHRQNGLLAEGNGNAASLSSQLEILMADASLREEMGKVAVQSVAGYTPDKIYPQWEKLL